MLMQRLTLTALTWKTAMLSWYGLNESRYISLAGIRYLIWSVRWSSNSIELVESAIKIGTI